MTIEIKQLVVRAVVEPRREGAPAATGPRAPAEREPAARTEPPAKAEADLDALVAECTRQVLRELSRRRSR